MPIFEYRCQQCGEKFEVFVRSTLTENDLGCPSCGGKKVEKAFSVFGSRVSGGKSTSATPSADQSSCSPVG